MFSRQDFDNKKILEHPTPSTAFMNFNSETSLSTAELNHENLVAQPAAESLYKSKNFRV